MSTTQTGRSLAGAAHDIHSSASRLASEPEPVEPAQSGLFDQFYAAVKRVNSAMTTLAAFAIVVIMLFTLWEIVTRYFLRHPATWTLPINSYLLLAVIYFATSYVLQKGDHVRIDFVLDMLGPSTRARMEIVSAMLSLLFVAFLLWIFSQRAGRIFERWERDSSTLNIPLIVPALIMAVGMLFMTLTAICGVVERARHPERFARPRELSKLVVD